MARLRCPDCGEVVEADPSSRCPRCAWGPGQPLRARPRPMAPPGAVPPNAIHGARRSRMAVWAFVLSLTPVVSLVLSAIAEASLAGGSEAAMAPAVVLGGIGSVFAIGGPVAAIAMGLAARRDPTVDQRSRNLALAAVLIGSITLGLYVLAVLLIILFIAACAAACGGGCATVGAAASVAPCASLRTTTATTAGQGGSGRRNAAWKDALAHHPDIPALRPDVYRVAGRRLCVGCFTAGPAFALGLAACWAWSVPVAWAAAAGLPLAAAQALSAVGWTTGRARKVAVKASFGLGAALVLHALLASPWPEEVRSLALAACGLLALASTRPRLRRIARLSAAADAGAA